MEASLSSRKQRSIDPKYHDSIALYFYSRNTAERLHHDCQVKKAMSAPKSGLAS